MGAPNGRSLIANHNAKKKRPRVCVLLSGGLDSAALVGLYLKKGRRVRPVYVAGGLRWEKAELHWLRRYLSALGSPLVDPPRVLRLDQKDLYPAGHWALRGAVPGRRAPDESVYLDGRNLLLLCKAGVVCAQERIGAVALAILRGNPFPDATPAFFRAMERALNAGLGYKIRISAPFARARKRDLVRAYADLPLELTFSCIRPSGMLHCGRCAKCAERKRAFRDAGVPDRTRYFA